MIDVLSAKWSSLTRWDYKSAKAAEFKAKHPHFRPLGDYVEAATVVVDPRKTPDQVWEVYGVTNQIGVYKSGEYKGEEFTQAQKRVEADWFFHNPTRAVVGSIGRVGQVGKFALTSPEYQVWRLKQGSDFSVDFVEVLVRTPLFLQLVNWHRRGAVKERLFVENLREIPVPPVSATDQRKIVKQVRAAKKLLEQGAKKLAAAQASTSDMLDTYRAPAEN